MAKKVAAGVYDSSCGRHDYSLSVLIIKRPHTTHAYSDMNLTHAHTTVVIYSSRAAPRSHALALAGTQATLRSQ
jgi:hypothetical protein